MPYRSCQLGAGRPDVAGCHRVGRRAFGVHVAAVVPGVLRLVAPVDKLAINCSQVDLVAEDLAYELPMALIANGLGEGRRQHLSSVTALRIFEQIRDETEMT